MGFGALDELDVPRAGLPRAWRSSPDDCALHPEGPLTAWRGLEVTRLPLVDTRHGVFARLTYADALKVAARFGLRLGKATEFDLMHAHGFEPSPCIAKLSPAERAAGEAEGLDEQTTFGRFMVSLAWAQKHDACLWSKLAKWDKQTPVSNAGKQWVFGAPQGRAYNYGWFDSNHPKGRWQGLSAFHDEHHHDYSQLTMLFRGGGSTPDLPKPPAGGGGPTVPGAWIPPPGSLTDKLPGHVPPWQGPNVSSGGTSLGAAVAVGALAAGLYLASRR